MPINDAQWHIWSAIVSLACFLLCAVSWLIALVTLSAYHSPAPHPIYTYSNSDNMDNFGQGCSSSGLAMGLGTKGLGIHLVAMGVCGSFFIFNVIKYYRNRGSDGEAQNAIVLIQSKRLKENQCSRCKTVFNTNKKQKRILCIKCNLYVCKGCSKWDPKCQTRNCKSCIGTYESPSPEWIHSKLMERCRRFESAKKLMAMQKGSDEFDNDIENDSGYNGPSMSPVSSSDTNVAGLKKVATSDAGETTVSAFNGEIDMDPSALYLHEHIESIVEKLIEGSLENVSLEPLFQNPEYERMIEIYHRRISDALSQLIQSIQQAQANMELTTDQTPTSTHSVLKYIVKELIEEAKELPLLMNIDGQYLSTSSAYLPKDEDFNELSYEEILSTAIINKVIEKFQINKRTPRFGEPFGYIDDRISLGSRTSSVSNKEIQTDFDFEHPVPLPRRAKSTQSISKLSNQEVAIADEEIDDLSWAKDFVKSTPIQYMVEEQIEEIITTVKNGGSLVYSASVSPDLSDQYTSIEPPIEKSTVMTVEHLPLLDSYLAGFEFVQSHRVPFPEFGVDIYENHFNEDPTSDGDEKEGDNSEETMLKAMIDDWEKNWLFRKKKSVSPFRNMGNFIIGEEPIAMLVPNPQTEVRAKIGNRDIDELSDTSDKIFDDEILNENFTLITNKEVVENPNLGTEIITRRLSIDLLENESNDRISTEEESISNDFSLDEHIVDSTIVCEATLTVSNKGSSPQPKKESSSEEDKLRTAPTNVISENLFDEMLTTEPEKSQVCFELRTWERRLLTKCKNTISSNCFLRQLKTSTSLPDGNDSETNSLSRPSVLPGTIAEREHKKWENAVQISNNPYTAENIAKRNLQRGISFSGKSTWSLALDQSSNLTTSQNVTKIDCGPKSLDLSKYQRDYFVNEASGSKKINRTGSCPGPRPTSLQLMEKNDTTTITPSTQSDGNYLHSNSSLGSFLEGKVARAVALVNENENEISLMKENLNYVRQEIANRRLSEDKQINKINFENEEKPPVPIPSPRTRHKPIIEKEKMVNGHHQNNEISQANFEDLQESKSISQSENHVKRVHSLTARCLPKDFYQSVPVAQNNPKHSNRNFLIIPKKKSEQLLTASDSSNQETLNSDNWKNSGCNCKYIKSSEDTSRHRLPWVEDDGRCNCTRGVKKKISSAIASRASFWDRRVLENRMTDPSMCDEFPSMSSHDKS